MPEPGLHRGLFNWDPSPKHSSSPASTRGLHVEHNYYFIEAVVPPSFFFSRILRNYYRWSKRWQFQRQQAFLFDLWHSKLHGRTRSFLQLTEWICHRSGTAEGRKCSFREPEETELPLDKSHLLLETVDGSFLKHCFLEKKWEMFW